MIAGGAYLNQGKERVEEVVELDEIPVVRGTECSSECVDLDRS